MKNPSPELKVKSFLRTLGLRRCQLSAEYSPTNPCEDTGLPYLPTGSLTSFPTQLGELYLSLTYHPTFEPPQGLCVFSSPARMTICIQQNCADENVCARESKVPFSVRTPICEGDWGMIGPGQYLISSAIICIE